MHVRLRVLQGKLQDRKGDSAYSEITVTRQRFVIGSGDDCHMRCQSRTISSHHCVLLIDDASVTVRDLGSDQGTFVNGQRIALDQLLLPGDRLRIGKLEFEVLFDRPVLRTTKGDAVDHLVSDLLAQADEAEREQRLHDPLARQFRLPASDPAAVPATPAPLAATAQGPPGKKKPPGKLPPPPSIEGRDTIDAAQKALEKLFQKNKK